MTFPTEIDFEVQVAQGAMGFASAVTVKCSHPAFRGAISRYVQNPGLFQRIRGVTIEDKIQTTIQDLKEIIVDQVSYSYNRTLRHNTGLDR